MIFPLVALLFQAALCLVASAATNYSVDDRDPLFHYSGTWVSYSDPSNFDKGGGEMYTSTAGSFANITYTFASVYFLSPRWPYFVSTDFRIDGHPPITANMTDRDPPVPQTPENVAATVPSDVVAWWTGTENQEHTIFVTIPAGGRWAVVDMFIFEVLDPSITSSIISSTSQTSTSTSATSTTQGLSSSVQRDLAISMSVVGTSLAILLIFLLWRFCIRRKGGNSGNINQITPQYHPVPIIPGNGTHDPLNNNLISMSDGPTSPYGLGIQNNNQITPQYHPVPTTLGNDTHVPFNDNPISVTSVNAKGYYKELGIQNNNQITPQYHPVSTTLGNDTHVPFNDNPISVTSVNAKGYYELGIQNNNLYGPPVTFSYDGGSSSYSGLPSTLYTNQSGSSSPLTSQVLQEPQFGPQRRISTLSTMTDRPPMYCRSPNLDESTLASSSSSNGNTNDKSGESFSKSGVCRGGSARG